MKTDSLIRALAADAAKPVMPLRPLMSAALATGAASSLALFAAVLRPRADITAALQTGPFWTKLLIVACVAASAAGALDAVARPLPRRASLRWLALAPLLLIAAVFAELWRQPTDTWWSRLLGHNAIHCLACIPLLAVAPALCLMLALRHGAPARPGVAGAIAGLAAAGLGACLYAITCPDDSPLFIVTWYSISIGVVTALCSLIGRRWLRW
jgi:hypothetical protein